MRISNDGYINNTSDKIYQADKKSKVTKDSNINNENKSGINTITASIRESSLELVSLQTLITREQVAYEGNASLRAKLGEYLSRESLTAEDFANINAEIKNTMKNTVFNGEQVLKSTSSGISSREELKGYLKTLEQASADINTQIAGYKDGLKKLELKRENQLASLSVSTSTSAENEVKDVIKNLGLLFNIQSNIKNDHARELLA